MDQWLKNEPPPWIDKDTWSECTAKERWWIVRHSTIANLKGLIQTSHVSTTPVIAKLVTEKILAKVMATMPE